MPWAGFLPEALVTLDTRAGVGVGSGDRMVGAAAAGPSKVPEGASICGRRTG